MVNIIAQGVPPEPIHAVTPPLKTGALDDLLAQLPFPEFTPEAIHEIHELYSKVAPLVKNPPDQPHPTLEIEAAKIEEQLTDLEQNKANQPEVELEKILLELNKIVEKKPNKIEEQLTEVEKTKKPQKVVETAGEVKEWGLDYVDKTKEVVRDGVEFLESVLPSEVFETHGFQVFEEFKKAGTLGLCFISALDAGTSGIAFFCKVRILNQTRLLIDKVKTDPALASLSKEEQEKIEKQLKKWEMNLQLAETSLESEKLKFGIEASYSLLFLSSTALDYTPVKLFPGVATASSALSWALSSLWIVLVGVCLRQAKKDTQAVTDWRHGFQQWLSAHQPRSENPIEKEPSIPLTPRAPLTLPVQPQSDNEHKQVLDTLIQGTQDLLTKREAIAHKKVLELTPKFNSLKPKIETQQRASFDHAMNLVEKTITEGQEQLLEVKELLEKWGFTKVQHPEIFQALEDWKVASNPETKEAARHTLLKNFQLWKETPDLVQKQFNTWFQAQSPQSLLQTYIAHQETLEQTTKNALNQMIQQKHEIEENFLDFKQIRLQVHFNLAALSLGVSVILAIVGLLTTPFGGAGLIFLMLSAGSFAVTVGMIGASCYLSYREKPHTTQLMMKGFQFKLLWANLRTAIQNYSHQAKDKKLKAVAEVLFDLVKAPTPELTNHPNYQRALTAYQIAKDDFDKSQEKVKEWTERAKKLQAELTSVGWQDFVQQVDLKNNPSDEKAFDTLRAFNEAFQACDLQLLSPEMKSLLEVQLGLDVEAIQIALRKDPEAFKKTLQKFFTLDDASLVSFIRQQEAAIGIGLTSPLKT